MSGGYLEGLCRIDWWVDSITKISEEQERGFTEQQRTLMNKFNADLLEFRAILNDFDYAVEGDKSFNDFFAALEKRFACSQKP